MPQILHFASSCGTISRREAFGHKSAAMPKPKLHEFRIRMSPELNAVLDSVRGTKSKNQQINEWLADRAQPDDAERVALSLRPILERLKDDDRAEFVDRLISALDVLSAGLAKKPRR